VGNVKVLVHYNPRGTEAYGIWWVDPDVGLLRSVYHDDSSPQAARGRVIVFGKSNPEVSWSEWFDMLTTRTPYMESWVVYDSMGLTPRQMLRALEPAPPIAS